MGDPRLLVGAGRAEFDLNQGELMAAFPRKPAQTRTADGVLDSLGARAIVLSDGLETAALCSVDLCMLREVTVAHIREAIGKRIPELLDKRVLFAATHTHAGPETSFLFGGSPDGDFVKRVEADVVETIESAYSNLAPARMSWSSIDVPLVHNRRITNAEGRSEMVMEHKVGVTTGPVDQTMQLVRFDSIDGAGTHRDDDDSKNRSGTALAVLCHYTAHALTLGPGNGYFSSDYPGRIRETIEKTCKGCTALFLNGAAGNVHPMKCMRADASALDEIGSALGEKAVAALSATQPIPDPNITLRSDVLKFANRMDGSIEVPVEIDLLDIGDLRLAFLPGEFFVEFQIAYNEHVGPRQGMFVGFANGSHGYVPTTESYETGGYGVDAATQDPPFWCRTALPRGAGEKIMARLFELAD